MLGTHDLLLFIGSGLLLNPKVALRWFNRCVGGIFIALGIRLAVARED